MPIHNLHLLRFTAFMNSTDDIAMILGGTGKTGRRVAERLLSLGRPVRIGSRSGGPPFDWDDRATWAPALRGAASVYITYQPDLAFPGAAERVSDLTEVASTAGVRRAVLLSGRNEEGARAGEAAVERSGMDWAIVRSSFFNQNFSESFLLDPIVEGTLAFPAGTVSEPFIDADDIAEVAAACLTEDRHLGQAYEVTGPELLTFAEVTDAISAAVGRTIAYVDISFDQFAEGLRGDGLPEEAVAAYVDLFTTVLDGRSAHLSDGVERALGRPARTFRDYVAATAATGVWDARPVAAQP